LQHIQELGTTIFYALAMLHEGFLDELGSLQCFLQCSNLAGC